MEDFLKRQWNTRIATMLQEQMNSLAFIRVLNSEPNRCDIIMIIIVQTITANIY